MAKEIDISSYLCDCGHESPFFENTIRDMKRLSLKKKVSLQDDHHGLVFHKGKAIEIICPPPGKVPHQIEDGCPFRPVPPCRTSPPPVSRGIVFGEHLIAHRSVTSAKAGVQETLARTGFPLSRE